MDLTDIQFLEVTSRLPKKFTARHFGIDYTFKQNEPVNLPVEAAHHIFGFGDDDKTPALHRLGWLTHTEGMEEALAKLGSIEFEPVKQVFELASKPRAGKRQEAATEGKAS
jgi:hypothetical protein